MHVHPIVLTNLSAIQELAPRHGVVRLELFGSGAGGSFDPDQSDLDFIATFSDSARGTGYADRYLALADALEALVNRPVDLLTPRSIRGLEFLRSIDASRTVIYERKRFEVSE